MCFYKLEQQYYNPKENKQTLLLFCYCSQKKAHADNEMMKLSSNTNERERDYFNIYVIIVWSDKKTEILKTFQINLKKYKIQQRHFWPLSVVRI